MNIHFVSDVVCPWCAVGLYSLERALERLGDVPVQWHIEPFELNPGMPAGGEDVLEHLRAKYGAGPEQLRGTHEALRQRGAAVGFTFDLDRRTRIWNTFDAHRLLHWAALEGRQRELKHALLEAYFTRGENPSDRAVLQRLAGAAGLDADRAQEVLASGAHADEVRARERHWTALGIHSVPAVIVDDRHLISGGQPPEVFERALRQIMAGGGPAG
jgi:predicted DsbA family dithiol-disulfide isomerase